MAKDVDEFLSEDESLITHFSNYHLTEDRVIKLVQNNGNRYYKDIQLENIASFTHSKNFNKMLAVFGGLTALGGVFTLTKAPQQVSLILILIGLAAVIIVYSTIDKEYTIRSDTDTEIELPQNSNSIEFWKSVNQEKNH
ncbi:MAG: hypothetical protein ABEK04_05800 [Candidatus Nanohalobium sp.]